MENLYTMGIAPTLDGTGITSQERVSHGPKVTKTEEKWMGRKVVQSKYNR